MQPDAYAAQIKAHYPQRRIDTVKLTDWGGQYNDILLVNGDTIFRFPKYELGVSLIANELAVLQTLQSRLPLPIPDPRYHHIATAGRSFIGYPRLPGAPLSRRRLAASSPAVQRRVAGQLAAFMRALQAVPVALNWPDEAQAIAHLEATMSHLFDIPTAELALTAPIGDTLPIYRGLFHAFRRHLYPHMRPDARAAMDAHFEAYFADPALHTFEPAWRHGDFGGSNILFDGERLTAVLDFSFTGVGDPAIDLAAVSTLGEPFLELVLEQFPEGRALLPRARFYRGVFALEEALHGVLFDDPNAFEAGIEMYR